MGNDSNFTGINWENVNGTANLIKTNATSVVHCMYTELSVKFLIPLAKAWVSENAVNWWNSTSKTLENNVITIVNIYDNLLRKIEQSVNIWCSRTGNASYFNKNNSEYGLEDYFSNAGGDVLGVAGVTNFLKGNSSIYPNLFKPQDNAGRTGMDIAVVRDQLLPIMTYTLNNAIEVVDGMPTSIGLYDNEGAQLASFNQEVAELKNLISELAQNLKSSIESYMQTEINNTLLAKQEVTNTLNS